jgi:hypothetical protein
MSVNPMNGIFGGGGAGGVGGILGAVMGKSPLNDMLGGLFNKIASNVLQGVIEDVAKKFGIPDTVKDAAQMMVASQLGDKEGVAKNGKELLSDILGDFQKDTDASDTDMGHVDREIQNLKEKFAKGFIDQMLQNQDSAHKTGKNGRGGSHGGGGGAGAAGAAAGDASGAGAAGGGGGSGAPVGAADGGSPVSSTDPTAGVGEVGADDDVSDWFMIVATALAKCAQKQADIVKGKAIDLSSAIDASKSANEAAAGAKPGSSEATAAKNAEADQMKKQTELQAESQKMGYMMQAINTALNSLGDALKTAARAQ